MGRKYKNSPIIEAICEFRFGPDTKWNFTFPLFLYEKLKDLFPKPDQELFINYSGKEELLIQPNYRAKLKSEDEKTLIQMGDNFFSINHLTPYTSWHKFKPLIEKTFKEYCLIVNPQKIERIGLRYINRIEIPKVNIKIEDYFAFYPFLMKKKSEKFDSFIIGVQIPYEDSRDILRIELSTTDSKSNISAFILDIQFFLANSDKFPLDNVLEWIEVAHNHIEEAFEDSISNNLKNIFEEVKK